VVLNLKLLFEGNKVFDEKKEKIDRLNLSIKEQKNKLFLF